MAQDASALYVWDGYFYALVRLPKDGSPGQTLATADAGYIGAADVDEATFHVYYGTATNQEPTHYLSKGQLRSVTIFGGEPEVLVDDGGAVVWIAHDESFIYWLDVRANLRVRLQRMSKRDLTIDTLADDLGMPRTPLHVVMGNKRIFFLQQSRQLLAISKDGSEPTWTADMVSDVFTYGGAVYCIDEQFDGVTAWRLAEDGTGRRTLPFGEHVVKIFGIADDRTFFWGVDPNTYGSQLRVRHICSGEDEILPGPFTPDRDLLVDACDIFLVPDVRHVTKLEATAGFRIDSVEPAHAAPGDVVTIHGEGFERGMSITVDGADAATQSIEPTAIRMWVPPMRGGGEGDPADVIRVRQPGGGCTGAWFAVDATQ